MDTSSVFSKTPQTDQYPRVSTEPVIQKHTRLPRGESQCMCPGVYRFAAFTERFVSHPYRTNWASLTLNDRGIGTITYW